MHVSGQSLPAPADYPYQILRMKFSKGKIQFIRNTEPLETQTKIKKNSFNSPNFTPATHQMPDQGAHESISHNPAIGFGRIDKV
jgi:hypothetical protein